MQTIRVNIDNLRGINSMEFKIPYDDGLFAITGENGIGKTTLFLALSQLVYRGALSNYFRKHFDDGANIKFSIDELDNTYHNVKGKWVRSDENEMISIQGHFEGSLVFGNRFIDAHRYKVDRAAEIKDSDLIKADAFVMENMGWILKNDREYYKGLMRLRTKKLAQEYGFGGMPYFWIVNNNRISLYEMSTGEFLLVTILDFMNTTIIHRNKTGNYNRALLLIDEVELALHPSAQDRLGKFFTRISEKEGFCVYFSTHSVHILKNIPPERLFHIQKNIAEKYEIINPCYPAFATRSLYAVDGFDYLILVEDHLAKYMVSRVIDQLRLRSNKMICVQPVGGYRNTLSLQLDFIQNKVAGENCRIYSILDGDVQSEVAKMMAKELKYKSCLHTFLPVKSVEKAIFDKLITKPDSKFGAEFELRFCHGETLKSMLSRFKQSTQTLKDDGKNLYKFIVKETDTHGMSKEEFERGICSLIHENSDTKAIEQWLKSVTK